MDTDIEILVAHTADEHGDGGPAHHAWRCGWTEPDPQLVAENEQAARDAVERQVPYVPKHAETRSRVPLDSTTEADHLAEDRFGKTRFVASGQTIALCGAIADHRTATPFDPAHTEACADCRAALAI